MQTSPTNPTPSDGDRRRLLASPRFRLALLLFALNLLLGWPSALLVGGIAAWLGAKWLGLMWGVVIYGASWVLLGIAVLIGGQDVVSHSRWLVQRWLEKRQG